MALVHHHLSHRYNIIWGAANDGKHEGAGKEKPEARDIPRDEKKKEQETKRWYRPGLEHDEVVVGKTGIEGAGVASGFDQAGVVVGIHIINGALVAGELNRVGEDEHEEDQVQADEQEQPQIEHQQLLELAEGHEEVSDLPERDKK
mgnify:CR=1 FL=1